MAGDGDTTHFSGGSDWARYWTSTIGELAPSLLQSRNMTPKMLEGFRALYEDPHYWTSVMTFTASSGRKPA